ncbi:MAG: fatty acid desaturase [Phycisphaeraceae bacterium]|nr:fatty acid desaturase [Phycisphaeraceae bacterium]
MQRSNLRGAFQAVGHLALWACTGTITYICFTQQWWIGFAAALFCHGTIGAFFRGLAVHELGHGTVFRTMWLNRFFLRLYSLLGWWNYHEYAMSHTYHHRYTLHPRGDREVMLPRNPTLAALCILQLFTVNFAFKTDANSIFFVFRRLLSAAFNRYDDPWIRDLYEGQPEARRQAVRWARIVLAFQVVVIGGSFAIGQPILALIISGHQFIGNWLRYFVALPMHCGLRDDVPDFRLCVRTIRLNPLSEFLYWHMNWHTEHHMFAGVPCYNLSKIYEQVKDDMPVPRSLVGAWREMREAWRRQKTEPEYEFDTPLPPTAHPAVISPNESAKEDALESSIGDLAPKAMV